MVKHVWITDLLIVKLSQNRIVEYIHLIHNSYDDTNKDFNYDLYLTLFITIPWKYVVYYRDEGERKAMYNLWNKKYSH